MTSAGTPVSTLAHTSALAGDDEVGGRRNRIRRSLGVNARRDLPRRPPIIRVARSPFLRAIPAHLPILRVRRDLLVVIIGAALPLAAWLATHQLPRLIFRRLEILLTVAASPLGHTGGCRTLRGGFRNCYRVRYCVLAVALFLAVQLVAKAPDFERLREANAERVEQLAILGQRFSNFLEEPILLVLGDVPVSERAESGDFSGRLQRGEAFGVGGPPSNAARGARRA